MTRAALALVVVAVLAPAARADTGRPVDKGALGVGIILGEPTGICAKLYLADDQAVQAAVGSDFFSGGLQVHADYLFHPWILQDQEAFVLPVYLGPGVRLVDYSSSNGDHVALGLRGVIGMLFDFKAVPLDAFLEVAVIPEYDFGNGRGGHFTANFGAGVRYYF